MMRLFEDKLFEHWLDRDSGAVFEDCVFKRCRFENCGISITENPARRSIARRIELVNCEYAGGLSAAIVEDVLVDGLKTHGLLQTWAMVFKHVTLRGRIDRVMMSNDTASTAPSTMRAFEEANARYYEQVDWALDISRAEFKECDIRGIPACLIRRDPETQVVVTREKALQGQWRGLDLAGTYWQGWIDLFLKHQTDPDLVLVAPKRARDFQTQLRGLKLLREAGVAEPG